MRLIAGIAWMHLKTSAQALWLIYSSWPPTRQSAPSTLNRFDYRHWLEDTQDASQEEPTVAICNCWMKHPVRSSSTRPLEVKMRRVGATLPLSGSLVRQRRQERAATQDHLYHNAAAGAKNRTDDLHFSNLTALPLSCQARPLIYLRTSLQRSSSPYRDQAALDSTMPCFGAYLHKPVCQWVMCHGSQIPANAVPGGKGGGETIYVGRAVHDGDVLPGKVVPSHSCCYVSYAGAEYSHKDYQVLTSDDPVMVWVRDSHGSVPNGAVQGGTTSSGEPLYIGRALHKGMLTIGKVHPSHNCLYIPYGCKEHQYTDYEVLVCKTVNL